MGVKIKNGLQRYLNRLQGYKGTIKQDQIAEIVGDTGVSFAKEEYGGKATNIQAENRDYGVDVVARGKELAFMEYGTGIRGKGKYQGELPTEKLVFESRGKTQSTEGWEYNYWKEQQVRNGVLNADDIKDFEGIVPQAQMFKTSQRLRRDSSVIADKIREKIKENKG